MATNTGTNPKSLSGYMAEKKKRPAKGADQKMKASSAKSMPASKTTSKRSKMSMK
jgi:hypothetical protein